MKKNKELQQYLNDLKWNKSIIFGDLSGKMEYCKFCKYENGGNCRTTQDKIDELSICAKAFNKMNKEEQLNRNEESK